MLSALYAAITRPSVTQVNQPKTVEFKIMKFSPYKPFLTLNVSISKTVGDTSKVTINDY